ncbi:DUF4189 domain-containing protein [Stenotrophomonas sp. TWI700]|uniref:DUF4189 domain-containing protein n=1 Tax=Stenotrophomonas sp. TWI700 TaxID=3136792 RepID=UPI00320802A3
MTNKFILAALFFAFWALVYGNSASAEGRCPPGQYPIGDSRAPGCAPIPGGGAGSQDSGPVPTGKWLLTWGAVSTSGSTGDAGASVGKPSKTEALKEARVRCEKYGAKDCSKGFAYKNQCVALAFPQRGVNGRISISSAGSKELATSNVLETCKKNGGGDCTVSYADCTEPVFKSF